MQSALDLVSHAQGSAVELARLLLIWREPLLFVALAAECVPFLGFASPGLVALALAGFIAFDLGVEAGARLLVVAYLAVLLPDYIMFALGRWGSARCKFIARLVGPRAAFGAELARQPYHYIIFYQFPPYSRMFAPVLLGNSGLSWRRWGKVSSLATTLFVAAFFALGWSANLLREGIAGLVYASGLLIFLSMSGLLFWCLAFVLKLWRGRGIDDPR